MTRIWVADRPVKLAGAVARMRAKVIMIAGLGGFAGFAALLGAGTASADVHVCIPGYTDNTGAAMAAAKASQGYPCDEVVQYSADVGLPGEVPAYLSIAEAAAGAQAAVDRHPGEKVVVEGWSLGAIGAADFGNKALVNGALPPNVELIQDDNAYASTGAFNHPLAPLPLAFVGPLMGLPDPADIPPVPNSIHRYNYDSAWGNLAAEPNDIVHDVIQVAMVGQNHVLVDQDDPHQTFVGADGVINEVYGGAPAPAPVIQSSVPSFPGELPCPGGYFTPGDSPC